MSWMKKQTKSIWADHKTEFVLGILGTFGAIALIIFTYPAFLSPSDTIQSITLILLVIVTTSYAKSTHKTYEATSEQVKATREAVRVALNAEQNSVAPLVKLNAERVDFGEVVDKFDVEQIRITFENIGNGPALNAKIWLEKPEDDTFEYLPNNSLSYFPAIGMNEPCDFVWPEKKCLILSLLTHRALA
ncbi:MAG: hypothetical protein OXI16_00160 [Chloroflexota bacterium]|nr:hypothetical protein [Chloroflexota bacterium]